MIRLKEFLLENLFGIDSWSHHGAYDYPKMVINKLLNNEKILLGINGDAGEADINDFDREKLEKILSDIENTTSSDFDVASKNTKKVRWKNIFKGAFSGQIRKVNGGMDFEDEFTIGLQKLILNQQIDDSPHKSVIIDFYNRIKNHPTINTLRKRCDEDNINKYVFRSGKGSTERNKYNQILNSKTFDVNINKKLQVDDNDIDKVENVLTQSGKIIADVTITLDKDFNKSDINHVNKSDIYISLKDSASQFSGISLQQPFYGNCSKKNNNSYLIQCYRQNKSYEEFASSDDISSSTFKGLCNFLGVSPKLVYDYFKQDRKDRKRVEFNVTNNEKSNEIISILIQLLIGGNYWYVNSNGHIYYINDNIETNKFKFVADGKGYLESTMIAVTGYLETKNGKEKTVLKFRDSSGNDDSYPFRLFIVPSNKNILGNLFE